MQGKSKVLHKIIYFLCKSKWLEELRQKTEIEFNNDQSKLLTTNQRQIIWPVNKQKHCDNFHMFYPASCTNYYEEFSL